MDRFETMGVFVAVVEAGSLSAAARRLGLPLTTLSRRLSALEERLGVRLLTRSTRSLALTEAGRRYLDACRRVLADLEDAERAAAGEHGPPRGLLTVTAPILFGRLHVLPLVTDYLRRWPEADARLVLLDRLVNLIEEGMDAAWRTPALPASSLIAVRVGAIRDVTCASPTYLAARGTPQTPDDLRAHDCISFTTAAPPT